MNLYLSLLERQLSLWATIGSVETEQVIEEGVSRVKVTITYRGKNVAGLGEDKAQAIDIALHKARAAFLD